MFVWYNWTSPIRATSAQVSEDTKIISASKRKIGDVLSNYNKCLEDNELGSLGTADVKKEDRRILSSSRR